MVIIKYSYIISRVQMDLTILLKFYLFASGPALSPVKWEIIVLPKLYITSINRVKKTELATIYFIIPI